MPRPKKKEWNRPGLDKLVIEHLYSSEVMADITARIRIRSLARVSDFRRRLLIIAAQLNFNLSYQDRPSSGQIKASLTGLQKSLASLAAQFEFLDDETKNALIEEAGKTEASFFEDDYIIERFGENDGNQIQSRQRYSSAIGYISTLLGWVDHALNNTVSKVGRPRLSAEQEAVSKLVELWSEPGIKPHGATESELHDFVHAVLDPVLKQYGDVPDLRAAIRYAQEFPDNVE